MTTSRRTLLAFLGLAPASVAIGSETFREVPDKGHHYQLGYHTSDEIIVNALKKLVQGIEEKSISVEALDFNSSLRANEIASHTLSIKFVYFPEHELKVS